MQSSLFQSVGLLLVGLHSLSCNSKKAIEEGTCSDEDDDLFEACIDQGCSASKTNSADGYDNCDVDGSGGLSISAGGSCAAEGSGSCVIVCDCSSTPEEASEPSLTAILSTREGSWLCESRLESTDSIAVNCPDCDWAYDFTLQLDTHSGDCSEDWYERQVAAGFRSTGDGTGVVYGRNEGDWAPFPADTISAYDGTVYLRYDTQSQDYAFSVRFWLGYPD